MNTQNPYFSIIIPSYKTQKHIVERAINSVLEQTYKNIEVLIIDDNDDNEYKQFNYELEQQYKNNNIKFYFHTNNKGANQARNTGIINAKGKYIAFIDSDDQWHTNYLQIIYNNIQETKGKLYTTNYQIITDKGILEPCFNKNKQKSGYIYEHEILEDLLGPTSTVCVLKDALIEAGMFDISLPARQDYDMWLRICKKEQCYFIHQPLILVYRDGHESISSSYKRHLIGCQIVLDKLLNDPSFSAGTKKNIKYSHYKHMAKTCILHNEYIEARKYIKKAVYNKFDVSLLIWYTLCYTPSIFKLLKKYRQKNKLTIQ